VAYPAVAVPSPKLPPADAVAFGGEEPPLQPLALAVDLPLAQLALPGPLTIASLIRRFRGSP